MIKNLPKSIALELVPRTLESLLEESKDCMSKFPLTTINVPEIRTVPVKSYESARMLIANHVPVTPHFRMVDRSLTELIEKLGVLTSMGLREVLIIAGDPPKDLGFQPSGLTSVLAIREIRKLFPTLKIFAGLDPFRTSFREELDYAKRKLDAGADGFYTQPFFSVGMLEQWMEQIPEAEVWYGIAPVLSEKSKFYWENTNKVVFPPDFDITLESNVRTGRALLKAIADANQRAYLMPVRVDAAEYVGALLNEA